MRILVEEEYGYRHWSWEVKTSDGPPSFNAMRTYFDYVVKTDKHWYCSGVPSDHFIGEWKRIDHDEYKNRFDSKDFDAWAHIHQNDDSQFVAGEHVEQ